MEVICLWHITYTSLWWLKRKKYNWFEAISEETRRLVIEKCWLFFFSFISKGEGFAIFLIDRGSWIVFGVENKGNIFIASNLRQQKHNWGKFVANLHLPPIICPLARATSIWKPGKERRELSLKQQLLRAVLTRKHILIEKSLYSNIYHQLFPVESGIIFRLTFGTWENSRAHVGSPPCLKDYAVGGSGRPTSRRLRTRTWGRIPEAFIALHIDKTFNYFTDLYDSTGKRENKTKNISEGVTTFV